MNHKTRLTFLAICEAILFVLGAAIGFFTNNQFWLLAAVVIGAIAAFFQSLFLNRLAQEN